MASAIVDTKTNEIPVAQKLLANLDLEGRLVSLDALHTQTETSRTVVLDSGGDYLLTVKANQPTLLANILQRVPAPEAGFPLEAPTPTQARTCELNKGRLENRSITTRPVSGEEIGFPLASQVARLLRQTTGRDDECVALITSATPEKLPALAWLGGNRAHWGVESMHNRLDVSQNDDLCRIRHPNGMLVLGRFRRLSNSLFMEWRAQRAVPHPEFLTTTDFHSDMGAEHCSRALRLVLNKKPKFHPRS